jgi:hypothetical protein
VARLAIPKFKSSRVTKCVLILLGALLGSMSVVACKSGGSVSSSSTGSSVTGALAVTLAYPTAAGSNWTPIFVNNRYYIKGLSLSIIGTCTPGIATITFNEGGANYTETATCSSSGTFTFTKSDYVAVTGEGDKTINLTGLNVSGTAITGATTSVLVRIDDTPPPLASPATTAPSIATTSMNPFQYSGSTSVYLIAGTVSVANGNAVSMSGPGGVNVPLSGAGAFTYSATLTDGATLSFPFIVSDQAGNQSTFTVYIQWAPSLNLVFSNMTSGGFGLTTSANTSLTMESAVYGVGLSEADATTGDSVTPVTLKTGPNSITNEARDY